MPWKESNQMDQRMTFISRILQGEKITDLCLEYEISRKTGHKFLKRYKDLGIDGLKDVSKKPHHIPFQTTYEIEQIILDLKNLRQTWGPKKLKAKLEVLNPGLKIPAASTIGNILERHGLVKSNKRTFKATYHPSELTNGLSPNHVWCTDFKGQFRLGNKKYCYPLTTSDHKSRFVLSCEALENVKVSGAINLFESVFDQYGLPEVIRSDNGCPFASIGLAGLSKLSVWWVKLGIRPERIRPGCPQENGQHERFHLTLKQETTRPPKNNVLQQQEYFDNYIHDFNYERPHEGIGQKTPGSIYTPSTRKYLGFNPKLEYPLHDTTRKVNICGMIRLWKDNKCYIGRAFAGEELGLREIENNIWLVSFSKMDLGYINSKINKFFNEIPLSSSED